MNKLKIIINFLLDKKALYKWLLYEKMKKYYFSLWDAYNPIPHFQTMQQASKQAKKDIKQLSKKRFNQLGYKAFKDYLMEAK